MLIVVCLCRNEGERGPGTEETSLESIGTKVWSPIRYVYTEWCIRGLGTVQGSEWYTRQ